MGQTNTSLDKFVIQATTMLAETEANLTKLAQAALQDHSLSPESSADHTHEQLQKVSQQLLLLAERSRTLHTYLNNGFDTPPVDDHYWPLVRILQSQEEEQTQLAREIEDRIGQLLANSVFELASCRHLLEHDISALSDGLESLQKELEQGLADARWFVADLEPATILGNFGLGGGIRRYLERFEKRTSLTCNLQVKANIGRLPSIIETAIFRVIQESLNNVYRHAEATQIDVIFEENNTTLTFRVVDNGQGIAQDEVSRSRKNFGLARMVDYAELLNGELRVFSNPGKGTEVILVVPYPVW